MNITVKVDEVSLETVVAEVVAFDEDGDPYPRGEKTMADIVGGQIVQRVISDRDAYPPFRNRVLEIRDEEIREAVRPMITEALTRPIKQTNRYGEETSQETTLSEIIVEEARKLLNSNAGDSYNRDTRTVVQKMVADEVTKALGAEIKDAVKQARDAVSIDIGQQVAAAVTAGLRVR